MSASPKQIKLISDLQSAGAPIPCDENDNPDASMFDSVAKADAYIKEHYHFLRGRSLNISAADYGGIPNH